MISESGTLKLEKFTDQIIFMSIFNDIDWTRKGIDLVKPQLCHQEKSVSWSSTRTDYEAEHLQQSPQYAQKDLWKAVPHNLGKVPNRFSLSGIIDKHWLG